MWGNLKNTKIFWRGFRTPNLWAQEHRWNSGALNSTNEKVKMVVVLGAYYPVDVWGGLKVKGEGQVTRDLNFPQVSGSSSSFTSNLIGSGMQDLPHLSQAIWLDRECKLDRMLQAIWLIQVQTDSKVFGNLKSKAQSESNIASNFIN